MKLFFITASLLLASCAPPGSTPVGRDSTSPINRTLTNDAICYTYYDKAISCIPRYVP